ncbi:MAG: type II toxin-antitoxin system RelE/ParE family toxin [Magnetospirillum sp.]|nr:type II toxin-antitoxin system RelE/ParE family toxin [Magnetospirillum sp.]
MTFEIARAAERDIKDILAETLKVFGMRQLAVYAAIIDKGMAMVGDDPERAGSIDRSEIGRGVRLFHLELAADRRGAAAHCLYYATGEMSNGANGTIVLRVLHEHMEPRYKVVRSLKKFAGPAAPFMPQ